MGVDTIQTRYTYMRILYSYDCKCIRKY